MTDIGKVIKDWEAVLSRDPLDAPWDLIDDTLELLKEYQKIVRCKDCRHNDGARCENLDIWVEDDPDWFCADGEKADT